MNYIAQSCLKNLLKHITGLTSRKAGRLFAFMTKSQAELFLLVRDHVLRATTETVAASPDCTLELPAKYLGFTYLVEWNYYECIPSFSTENHSEQRTLKFPQEKKPM